MEYHCPLTSYKSNMGRILVKISKQKLLQEAARQEAATTEFRPEILEKVCVSMALFENP